MVVLDVNLDQKSPLLSVLSQLCRLHKRLGVLPAHVNRSRCIKNGDLVLVILNQLTNLVELLLLHVAVEKECGVIFVVVDVSDAVSLLVHIRVMNED